MGVDECKVSEPELISGESRYIPLTRQQSKGIDEWVLKGLSKGYIAGPFDLDFEFDFGKLFLAPLFVVPKPNGKWRTIVHLSFKTSPEMYSINDLLFDYMKTVQYTRFLEVVKLVKNAGKGAFLFLVDAQDAYYRVPTSPKDWKYMGIKWRKKYWVFRSLQMGMSSSPRIYTAFADAVEYICVQKNKDIAFLNGIQQLRHYIDDFFGALPTWEKAWALYQSLYKTFEELGIPTKWEKCTAPSTQALILGWLYDTLLQMVILPEKKRVLLLDMINTALRTKKANKRWMQQLLGRLQHASIVVFPGKAFVRRLEALVYLPQHDDYTPFKLGNFVLDDLEWWRQRLTSGVVCGTSFDLLLKHPSDGDVIVYTDACTETGGGGYITGLGNTIFFQVKWANTIYNKVANYRKLDISVLELLMSVVAIYIIRKSLKNLSVSIFNDNPGAAGAIRSKAPPLFRLDLQVLTRFLATLAFDNKFYFWGIHKTVAESDEMKVADALSRYNPVGFSGEAIQCNIVRECNILLDLLWKEPLNLPSSVDISADRRAEFGLLFDVSPLVAKRERVEYVIEPYNILK